ncbi:S-adenosylmethionine-dependent nucleotide dehydratase RSAD2-like [Cotesia typhae]|uniref:S-adenosylmethionine-dependent nucleotide dehydratase RSAD2-like n=1 Tax=Cotesia typhae TaxID=2053667 RepID=UPI003D68F405
MCLCTCIVFILTIAVIFFLRKFTNKNKNNTQKFKMSDENKKFNKNLISVNFHFTRKCNYECGFCFHTAKTSHYTELEEAKRGLRMVKEVGMKKINFSGGEPFLYPKYLGELIKFCKLTLELESTSIVSNGSQIKESWFQKYAKYLDILAISVDSFDEETNIRIGRGRGRHLEKLSDIRDWCEKYNVKFKLNSVIGIYNWQENMVEEIENLNPFRWKVFQCLLVDTENAGEQAIRKASEFVISDEQFEDFCSRHRHLPSFVPEPNVLMKESYIILDEYMRFLNKGDVYKESKSILEVGVLKAMEQIDFDEQSFTTRGGIYNWTKTDHLNFNGNCGSDDKLSW